MFNLDHAENDEIVQLVNNTNNNLIPNQLNNHNQFSSETLISELTTSEVITPGVDRFILSSATEIDNLTYYPESHPEFIPNQPDTDPLTGIPINSEITASQINPTLPPYDNDLINARYLGVLNSNQFWQDSVSSIDFVDYYRFELNTTSDVNLFLSNLTGDADLTLLQDYNNNGFADFAETIEFSGAYDNISEEINALNLAPGTYYIEVSQYNGETNYELSLSATPSLNSGSFGSNYVEANYDNDLINARYLGVLNSNQFWQDSVSSIDFVDYYRFELDTTSDVNLSLLGLTGDADLTLLQDYNNNGFADFAETIEFSGAYDNISEEINALNLAPGTYYIEVSQYNGETNYELSLSATPSLNSGSFNNPSDFSSTYGYGLVDANAAVAQTISAPTPFPEVPDVNDWDVDEINAPEVWSQGYTGQGIVVAVLDTGVDYNHFDLAANIWNNTDEIPNNGFDDDNNGFVDDIRGWNFGNNNNEVMDFDGHGTHIAGSIAAQQNGLGITGVAPKAQIMAVKISSFGGFYPSEVATGIYYAVDNGADVINLSIGGDFLSIIEEDAIRYAAERGVVVVMAAGNESSSFPLYPASLADRWGIAVGATDITGRIDYQTNYAGFTPLDYVVAPGIDVYSTIPNNDFGYKSGTSMATPHVAGVAALVLSANPSLTSEQVEYMITSTANPNQVII